MSVGSIGPVRNDLNEVMSRLRALSERSGIKMTDSPAALDTSNALGVSATPSTGGGFDAIMALAKDAVTNVNQVETTSEQLKTAYVTGDQSVSMSQVIVASQKSRLAFEGLVTVRNKLLDSYREIMNMTV